MMLMKVTGMDFCTGPVRLCDPDDFTRKSVYTITSRSTHTDDLGSILLKISERKICFFRVILMARGFI